MSVIKLSDADFTKEVKDQKGLVLVDFWAPWCGPCQMMGPIVDDLAEQYKDKIKFGKLNVDENPNTAKEFQIMSIPILMFFKDGKKINELLGAHDEETVIDKIEEVLANNN
ncbi:MAG: thioredoxin [Candidatus Moranbacteria bacterium]|nr:thioredoxin [Candidatus Moranbacteria bacterium]